jgi:hypothetical protein
MAVSKRELKPVVSVELSHEVSLSVDQRELLSVPTKHTLTNVKLKLLLFLSLLQSIKQNVVYSSFTAANNCFFSVLVHIHGLVLKYNLLFQFQVCFPKN